MVGDHSSLKPEATTVHGGRGKRTFVLEKVAHARAAREDKLGYILDDFGLVLWR